MHGQNGLYWYAFITVFSSVGSNVLNFVHSKKYCSVKITRKINWKKHMMPIMVLFATTVTVRIYSNSDVIILGLLCGDYEVGLYAVATKVYEVIKTILSSVIIVAIPRLAALAGKNNNAFSKTAESVYMLLVSIVMPSLLGIILLRKEVVLIISDESYAQATNALCILSVALIFSLFGWFWGQCVLVPFNKEKTLFIASAVSAGVNIVLNFILIPVWKQDAAAFTTLVAECVQFVWCWIGGRKYLRTNRIASCFFKSLVGCIAIVCIDKLIVVQNPSNILHCILLIPFAIVAYAFIEIVLKNQAVVDIAKKVLNKVKKLK